mmetsp:Transcript_56252/g.127880  ORF Transcript_56252/g.127880 Transcript_56252/m.127880 type:complete len:1323 (+) Transcript_56252:215-4183(+)
MWRAFASFFSEIARGGNRLEWSQITEYLIAQRADRQLGPAQTAGGSRSVLHFHVSDRMDERTHHSGVVFSHAVSSQNSLLTCEKDFGGLRIFSGSNPCREVGVLRLPDHEELEAINASKSDVSKWSLVRSFQGAQCTTCAYDAEQNFAAATTSRHAVVFWECGMTFKPKYVETTSSIEMLGGGSHVRCRSTFWTPTGVWHSQVMKCWLIAGSDFMLRTKDLRGRLPSEQLIGHQDTILDACDIGRHKLLATAAMDTTILLWDSGTMLQRAKILDCRRGIRRLAFHEEQDLLLAAGFDLPAYVFSPTMTSGKCQIAKLEGHIAPLVGIQAVQRTNTVVTADELGYVRMWDTRKWQAVQMFKPGQVPIDFEHMVLLDHRETDSQVSGLRKLSDGSLPARPRVCLIVAGSRLHHIEAQPDPGSGQLRVDERIAGQRFRHVEHQEKVPSEVVAMHLNFKRHRLLVAMSTSVQVRALATGCVVAEFHEVVHDPNHPAEESRLGQRHRLTAFCVNDSDSRFVVGLESGLAAVHNCDTGHRIVALARHGQAVSSVHWISRDNLIVSAGYDGCLLCHDASREGECVLVRRIEVGEDIRCMHYIPAWNVAASAGPSTIQIWDLDGVQEQCQLAIEPPSSSDTAAGTSRDQELLDEGLDLGCFQSLDPFPGVFAADSAGDVCFWTLPQCRTGCDCVAVISNKREVVPDSGVLRAVVVSSVLPLVTPLQSLAHTEVDSMGQAIDCWVDLQAAELRQGAEAGEVLKDQCRDFLRDTRLTHVVHGMRESLDAHFESACGEGAVWAAPERVTGEATLPKPRRHFPKQYVVLGDVQGQVSVINVTTILKAAKMRPPEAATSPRRGKFSFKHHSSPESRGMDMQAAVEREMRSAAQNCDGGPDGHLRGVVRKEGTKFPTEDFPVPCSWKAHSTVVCAIQHVLGSGGIATAGSDGIVKIWGLGMPQEAFLPHPALWAEIDLKMSFPTLWALPDPLRRSVLFKFQAFRVAQTIFGADVLSERHKTAAASLTDRNSDSEPAIVAEEEAWAKRTRGNKASVKVRVAGGRMVALIDVIDDKRAAAAKERLRAAEAGVGRPSTPKSLQDQDIFDEMTSVPKDATTQHRYADRVHRLAEDLDAVAQKVTRELRTSDRLRRTFSASGERVAGVRAKMQAITSLDKQKPIESDEAAHEEKNHAGLRQTAAFQAFVTSETPDSFQQQYRNATFAKLPGSAPRFRKRARRGSTPVRSSTSLPTTAPGTPWQSSRPQTVSDVARPVGRARRNVVAQQMVKSSADLSDLVKGRVAVGRLSPATACDVRWGSGEANRILRSTSRHASRDCHF